MGSSIDRARWREFARGMKPHVRRLWLALTFRAGKRVTDAGQVKDDHFTHALLNLWPEACRLDPKAAGRLFFYLHCAQALVIFALAGLLWWRW